jgi:gluconate kinase
MAGRSSAMHEGDSRDDEGGGGDGVAGGGGVDDDEESEWVALGDDEVASAQVCHTLVTCAAFKNARRDRISSVCAEHCCAFDMLWLQIIQQSNSPPPPHTHTHTLTYLHTRAPTYPHHPPCSWQRVRICPGGRGG